VGTNSTAGHEMSVRPGLPLPATNYSSGLGGTVIEPSSPPEG